MSEGGWLVELLLPRTDAGVLAQAAAVAVHFALAWRPARRAEVLQLWSGAAVFTAGLFMLCAVH